MVRFDSGFPNMQLGSQYGAHQRDLKSDRKSVSQSETLPTVSGCSVMAAQPRYFMALDAVATAKILPGGNPGRATFKMRS